MREKKSEMTNETCVATTDLTNYTLKLASQKRKKTKNMEKRIYSIHLKIAFASGGIPRACIARATDAPSPRKP